jgi:hypothetical protein
MKTEKTKIKEETIEVFEDFEEHTPKHESLPEQDQSEVVDEHEANNDHEFPNQGAHFVEDPAKLIDQSDYSLDGNQSGEAMVYEGNCEITMLQPGEEHFDHTYSKVFPTATSVEITNMFDTNQGNLLRKGYFQLVGCGSINLWCKGLGVLWAASFRNNFSLFQLETKNQFVQTMLVIYMFPFRPFRK